MALSLFFRKSISMKCIFMKRQKCCNEFVLCVEMQGNGIVERAKWWQLSAIEKSRSPNFFSWRDKKNALSFPFSVIFQFFPCQFSLFFFSANTLVLLRFKQWPIPLLGLSTLLYIITKLSLHLCHTPVTIIKTTYFYSTQGNFTAFVTFKLHEKLP